MPTDNPFEAKRMLNLYITFEMAFAGLLDIVQRFGPDHTASNPNNPEVAGCVYAIYEGHRLVPVCIVGQFFADLGILRLLMRDPSLFHNTDTATCNLGGISAAADNLRDCGVTLSEQAFNLLYRAQIEQDSGNTWGRALEKACQEALDLGHFTPVDSRTATEKAISILD